jgi:hypothetical protein
MKTACCLSPLEQTAKRVTLKEVTAESEGSQADSAGTGVACGKKSSARQARWCRGIVD